MEDLSYEEFGRVLQCPVGTVALGDSIGDGRCFRKPAEEAGIV